MTAMTLLPAYASCRDGARLTLNLKGVCGGTGARGGSPGRTDEKRAIPQDASAIAAPSLAGHTGGRPTRKRGLDMKWRLDHGQIEVLDDALADVLRRCILRKKDRDDRLRLIGQPVISFPRQSATAIPIGMISRSPSKSKENGLWSKLIHYREGGSEKHLRDITGILRISGDIVDREYVADFARQLGLARIWEAVLQRLNEPAS